MGVESVDILIQRAQVLRSRNVNQAMSLLDDALSIAQQTDYKQGMAQIIRDKASCFLIQKNYKRSITSFKATTRTDNRRLSTQTPTSRLCTQFSSGPTLTKQRYNRGVPSPRLFHTIQCLRLRRSLIISMTETPSCSV